MTTPLTLSLLDDRLAIVRLPAEAPFPAWVHHEEAGFWSITRTREAWSIVCDQHAVPPSCETVERGWRAFRVQGPLAFTMTGVVAGITAALAAAGIPVFVLSTYDTDVVLVKDEHVPQAVEVLGGRYVVRSDA